MKIVPLLVALAITSMSAISAEETKETIIQSEAELITYTSEVLVQFKTDTTKVGDELIKLDDGTCALRTTKLIKMERFKTSIPGTYIEAPNTQFVVKPADCNLTLKPRN